MHGHVVHAHDHYGTLKGNKERQEDRTTTCKTSFRVAWIEREFLIEMMEAEELYVKVV